MTIMTFRNKMNWTIDIIVSKDGVVVCFQMYVPQIDCLATPADVNWEIRTKVNPSQRRGGWTDWIFSKTPKSCQYLIPPHEGGAIHHFVYVLLNEWVQNHIFILSYLKNVSLTMFSNRCCNFQKPHHF